MTRWKSRGTEDTWQTVAEEKSETDVMGMMRAMVVDSIIQRVGFQSLWLTTSCSNAWIKDESSKYRTERYKCTSNREPG
jgi:hypothetical protein